MKRIAVLLSLALLSAASVQAQFIKNTAQQAQPGWQNQSYDRDGVYGSAIEEAKKYLSTKGTAKEVVVALIGPGIDVEHEDLAGAIWVNPGERQDGKDNDSNGYIDDINGWNFLASPEGQTIEQISRTSEREFISLQKKTGYADLIQRGEEFYRYDAQSNSLKKTAAPQDRAVYDYLQNKVIPESRLGNMYKSIRVIELVRTFIPQFDKQLKEKYPEGRIGVNEFSTLADPNEPDSLRMAATVFLSIGFMADQQADWEKIRNFYMNEYVEYLEGEYADLMARTLYEDRIQIGDNELDVNSIGYGNNNLLAENSGYGTLYAGIIAATPNNDIGIDGIAPHARILTLRVEADDEGEPYTKDIALAIRYAVDQGADIIQLGRSNTLYPVGTSQWVDDALAYAEEKRVLVIMPMMDYSYNVSEHPFYPNRYTYSGKTLENVLTVAASDSEGNPLPNTNFSVRELDLFAPGKDIYSTYIGDTYRSASGSMMAASVTTGVAALIKGYFPGLSGAELRKILMDSVTPRSDAEVEKEVMQIREGRPAGTFKDLFLMEELSVTGGILNAYQAIKEAEKISAN